MDKLQELNTIADNLEMSVESEGTEDKESFCVYKDGKVVAKGSYFKIKTKLEDLTYEQGMEAKLKELIEAGKSDEEIIRIMAETPYMAPEPDGGPMPDDNSPENEAKIKEEFIIELKAIYKKFIDKLFETGIYESQEHVAEDILEIVKDTKVM